MPDDKRTIHLIIWLAFIAGMSAAAINLYGLYLLAHLPKDLEPGIIQGQINTTTTAIIGMGGALLALLARTRSDTQPVEVTNTPGNPVPTTEDGMIEDTSRRRSGRTAAARAKADKARREAEERGELDMETESEPAQDLKTPAPPDGLHVYRIDSADSTDSASRSEATVRHLDFSTAPAPRKTTAAPPAPPTVQFERRGHNQLMQ